METRNSHFVQTARKTPALPRNPVLNFVSYSMIPRSHFMACPTQNLRELVPTSLTCGVLFQKPCAVQIKRTTHDYLS